MLVRCLETDKPSLAPGFIASAISQGSTSYLGRVFNEFSPAPINEVTVVRWGEQFKVAVKAVVIHESNGEFIVTMDEKEKAQIEIWVREMIASACEELVDDDGKLKQGIVTALGLQDLINKWKKDSSKSADIELQIVYSYCSQIIIPALIDRCDDDGFALGQLLRHVESLFVDKNTRAWTTIFREQFAAFTATKSFFEKTIATLKKTPVDELAQQIEHMVSDVKSAAVLPDIDPAHPSSFTTQIELWIDIMHYFREQADLIILRAIYDMVFLKVNDMVEYDFLVGDDRQSLSVQALQKYHQCCSTLNPAAEPIQIVTPATANAHSAFERSLTYLFKLFYTPVGCADAAKMENVNEVDGRKMITFIKT